MKMTKGKPISPGQLKALHATFRSKGFDEEDRHDFISRFTEGRVNSTKELTFNEARQMLERLNESDIKKKEQGTGGITEASEGYIQTVFWNLLSEQGI